MSHIKGKINIPPVEDLLQKSVDNIRLKAIQDKVNLESELDYNKIYIGSPMPAKDHINYLKKIGENYQRSKKLVLSLF